MPAVGDDDHNYLVVLSIIGNATEHIGKQSIINVMVDKQKIITTLARRRPKRPRDPNQLGKLIVDLSTGQASEELTDNGRSMAARAG